VPDRQVVSEMGERPAPERFLANPVPPGVPPSVEATETDRSPLELHRKLPGYEQTPLRRLPDLAQELDLAEVFVKDESERLGLPAFKMLGASWASYRALCERLGYEPSWSSVDELPSVFAALQPLTLTTATDGNHGSAVARFARLAGFGAHVLVPLGTTDARIEMIRSQGASVEIVDGTYDDAVARAAEAASASNLVVADTSLEGYEQIPSWVIDGYDTIFREVEHQLAELGRPIPDLVVVPLGVGALGAAAATFAERVWTDGRPALLGVEPTTAACVMLSVERGQLTEVPGPHPSVMVGLNCGMPSPIAFPRLQRRFAAFVAIADERAEAAMVRLAKERIVAGETGAAALGGLRAALELDAEGALHLGPSSSVLLLVTEGATDPDAYLRVVGATPEEVKARLDVA
jgi:diaminopropionate ammonia-lyase